MNNSRANSNNSKKCIANSGNVCPITLENLEKIPEGERFKACLDPNVYDVKAIAQHIFRHENILSPMTKVVISVPDIKRIFDQVTKPQNTSNSSYEYTETGLIKAMERSINAQERLIPRATNSQIRNSSTTSQTRNSSTRNATPRDPILDRPGLILPPAREGYLWEFDMHRWVERPRRTLINRPGDNESNLPSTPRGYHWELVGNQWLETPTASSGGKLVKPKQNNANKPKKTKLSPKKTKLPTAGKKKYTKKTA